MAKVELKNLCKSFSEKENVVDNVNLVVNDKEFVVLVGPSGCGKSTTLRMVAGLESISSGQILIDDQIVNEREPKDRDIAMVFQNYALYPHMTVFENMAFGLKIRKYKKDEIKNRVHEASKILGLDELLNRKPKALSGGQRQRVAVGRAIVRKPKVFLFDEPLSNLDAKLRVQMRTEISKLHQKLGATIIYVTHDQVEAMTMGDRIVVMKDGVIQQIDKPLDIYQNPQNQFVASFIGSPAMNFIDGSISKEMKFMFKSATNEIIVNLSNYEDSKLNKYLNQQVILGIRPEDIKLVDHSNSPSNFIESEIELAELMGNETYLYFKISNQQLIARIVTDRTFQIGEKIRLELDSKKVHLFASNGNVIQ